MKTRIISAFPGTGKSYFYNVTSIKTENYGMNYRLVRERWFN